MNRRLNLEHLESRQLLSARPFISEFVASNLSSLTDGYEEASDWIEIYNPSDETILLHDYYLTDDPSNPRKWRFPEQMSLGAGARLVVFASGQDAVDLKGAAHTNFRLDAQGEYLAIADHRGAILSDFDAHAGTFPALQADVSYGFPGLGLPPAAAPRILAVPTPGEPNVEQFYHGVLPPASISRRGGIYEGPLQVTIQAPAPGMGLVYTIDASAPTPDHGIVVSAEGNRSTRATISVDTTTVLQAITVRPGWLAPLPVARTYIYLNDVLKQDPVSIEPARFPEWIYTFDERVIAAGNETATNGGTAAVVQSLKSLPTMALVLDHDSLWSLESGIYLNAKQRGPAWRRPGSFEVSGNGLYFSSQAHIQMAGTASRIGEKRAFRVDLRDEMGGSDRQPITPLDNLAQFPVESVSLRVDRYDTVQRARRGRPDDRPPEQGPTYVRDRWLRETLKAMGHAEAASEFVHLYLNGLYWGVVSVTERVRSGFLETWVGGDGDSYDILTPKNNLPTHTEIVQGERDTWARLFDIVRSPQLCSQDYQLLQGKDVTGNRDDQLQPTLDATGLIDYVLTHVFAGATDWPNNNYMAVNDRSDATSGIQFFAWDQEDILGAEYRNWIAPPPVYNRNMIWTPLEVFRQLFQVPDFRIDVADAIYRHFYHEGALTLDVAVNRWRELAANVAPGILAEVARWAAIEPLRSGDDGPRYWTVGDWQEEVNRVANEIIPRNYALAMQGFREQGSYPSVDPPVLNQRGGDVSPGFDVELHSDQGTVYFTTNGSDPRALGGGVSDAALSYEQPVRLVDTTTLRARVLSPNGVWSALEDVTFEVDVQDAGPENLRITEVHYHPEPDGDTEFVELTNVGPRTVRLDGVRLEGGVTFDFGRAQPVRLGPAERLVLVRDRQAFEQTYNSGAIAVAGQYAGNLSNGGEQLTLRSASGQVIQQFFYEDDDGWPTIPDGGGMSLQLVDPHWDWTQPSSWRASAVVGGTPGRVEYPVGDANRDGQFNQLDIVLVLQAAKYLAGEPAVWEEGDWNGDRRFDRFDIVAGLQTGDYLHGDYAPLAVDEVFTSVGA